MGVASAASSEVRHLCYHCSWLCRPVDMSSTNQLSTRWHSPTTCTDVHCSLCYRFVPFSSTFCLALINASSAAFIVGCAILSVCQWSRLLQEPKTIFYGQMLGM